MNEQNRELPTSLPFHIILMRSQANLEVCRKEDSGGQEGGHYLRMFTKGICLKWEIWKEPILKPRHERDLLSFHNSFPPSLLMF